MRGERGRACRHQHRLCVVRCSKRAHMRRHNVGGTGKQWRHVGVGGESPGRRGSICYRRRQAARRLRRPREQLSHGGRHHGRVQHARRGVRQRDRSRGAHSAQARGARRPAGAHRHAGVGRGAAPSRGRHHPSRCLSRGPQMWPGSSTVQRAPAACRTSAAHPRRPPPAQPCSAGTQCEAAGTERHAMAGPGTSRTALHAKKYNRCVDLWPEARLRAVSGEEAEGAGPVGG